MTRSRGLLPPIEPELQALLPESVDVYPNALELAVTACRGQHLEDKLTEALAKLRRDADRPATMSELVQMCEELPARLADRFLLAVAENTSRQLLMEMPSEQHTRIEQLSRVGGWQESYHIVMRYLLGESLSASGIRKFRFSLVAA